MDISKQQVDRQASSLDSEEVAFWNRDIRLRPYQASSKFKKDLFEELYALLNAGVDLNTALTIVDVNTPKKEDKQSVKQIKEALIKGADLSECLSEINGFGEYDVQTIKIGEETGKLNEVIGELRLYYAESIKLRRQLISVLSYPIIILFVSIGSVAFLLKFLIPLFEDIFQRVGQELPAITQNIVAFSGFVNEYFWALGLLMLLPFGMHWMLKRNKSYRSITGQAMLRIPIFGKLIRKVYLARFNSSLAFLLGANVPLVRSLSILEKMIGFYPIESTVSQISDNLVQGASFHNAMSSFSFYPHKLSAIVKVGEETNQLPLLLKNYSNQLSEEIEQQSKLLGSVIEPIIILFLAVVVGVILVAMYMPIFKLVTNMGA